MALPGMGLFGRAVLDPAGEGGGNVECRWFSFGGTLVLVGAVEGSPQFLAKDLELSVFSKT